MAEKSDHPTEPPAPRMVDDVAAAVRRSRERGQQRTVEILHGPEMLTGEELGQLMGISGQAVHEAFLADRLLSVSGGDQDHKSPRWQLDETGKPLNCLEDVIQLLGQGWPAFRFLASPRADGRITYTVLAGDEKRLVLAEARAESRGDYA